MQYKGRTLTRYINWAITKPISTSEMSRLYQQQLADNNSGNCQEMVLSGVGRCKNWKKHPITSASPQKQTMHNGNEKYKEQITWILSILLNSDPMALENLYSRNCHKWPPFGGNKMVFQERWTIMMETLWGLYTYSTWQDSRLPKMYSIVLAWPTIHNKHIYA